MALKAQPLQYHPIAENAFFTSTTTPNNFRAIWVCAKDLCWKWRAGQEKNIPYHLTIYNRDPKLHTSCQFLGLLMKPQYTPEERYSWFCHALATLQTGIGGWDERFSASSPTAGGIAIASSLCRNILKSKLPASHFTLSLPQKEDHYLHPFCLVNLQSRV